MLEHLIAMIDDNPFVGAVTTPPAGLPRPDVEYAVPTKLQEMQRRLQEYNVDLPFTSTDKRRIVENMTFNEALMAVKSSDRLNALSMLGKMESINAFAAEKRVVEVTNTADLKSRILERLGIDPTQVEDATVINAPVPLELPHDV